MRKTQSWTEKQIKALWRRKPITKPFKTFYKWFMAKPQKCCYCGITEEQLALLHSKGPLTKRKRGRRLELERKDPEMPYDNFKNLDLACMWCNNAKTDTFTAKEFKKVGNVIRQIWQARLKQIKPAAKKIKRSKS